MNKCTLPHMLFSNGKLEFLPQTKLDTMDVNQWIWGTSDGLPALFNPLRSR